MQETLRLYASSTLASRLTGELAEQDVIADLSPIHVAPALTVAQFTVTMDNGQRFEVTVTEQEADSDSEGER
jgi:hypothetical protein